VLSLPPVFPAFKIHSYSFFKLATKVNAALTGFFINKAIKKLKMQDIISFNAFQPFLGQYWKIKNQKFSVYYIYDDFSNVPWFQGFVIREEAKFIEKTDLIIVSSDELKKRKIEINKPIEVVNNGVHFDSFFNQRKTDKWNESEIKTIGYTGTIDNRLDIDLLDKVIAKMPSRNFLFVGKIFEKSIYDRLTKYPNVYFQSPVPSESIPLIQRQMDIGIIPYVCNQLTAAIYPLKANEYLAMGLPVVMTPFASLGEADEVIYRAVDAQAFADCLEKALTENNLALKQKRYAIAKKANWNERAIGLMNIIDKYKSSTL
jgi:glycosyltransferase involved in cell wall biosynthesis